MFFTSDSLKHRFIFIIHIADYVPDTRSSIVKLISKQFPFMNSLWQIFLSFVAFGYYCKVCTVHVSVNISVARFSNAISNFFKLKMLKVGQVHVESAMNLWLSVVFLIKMRIFLQRNAFSMYKFLLNSEDKWFKTCEKAFFTFHYFNGRQIRTVLKLKISWVKLHLNEILYLFLY